MIAHVVLFSPKPDLSDEDRRALLDALASASSNIPSIKRFRVGKRVKHSLPGYEQLMGDIQRTPPLGTISWRPHRARWRMTMKSLNRSSLITDRESLIPESWNP